MIYFELKQGEKIIFESNKMNVTFKQMYDTIQGTLTDIHEKRLIATSFKDKNNNEVVIPSAILTNSLYIIHEVP
jgi:hypothetical protein